MRKHTHIKITHKLFAALCIVALLFVGATHASANEEEIERLQDEISDLNSELDKINKEIAEAQAKVAQSSAEANSLDARVRELKATRSKLEKDISYTETEIERSTLTIQKLTHEITDKQTKIERNADVLAHAIRELNMLRDSSFIETLLGYDSTSEFWNQLQAIDAFQNEVQNTVIELKDLNQQLQGKKQEETAEVKQLESSKKLLSGEREAVASTETEQAELLQAARGEEATYRQILAEKIRQREEFEEALYEYESQLQTLVDPDSYPDAKRGILAWPVDRITITQNFGGTQFAKANPHVYGRPIHNGTDFGIPIGTKVYSVADGVVVDTGNTDAFPGCVSWGKWVLVKHNNGLSTLYAHLSSILVSPGQSVGRGETIALSGNTGYSTGPHLHLTLYASQGVEVVKFNEFKAGSGCAATGASTPVAPLDAYLDPMEYLPSL